jgi:hypothetical protein
MTTCVEAPCATDPAEPPRLDCGWTADSASHRTGELIGGFLGTLDQALANRPRTVSQIEQRYREPWASVDGVTIEGLDEPIERPDTPDRSGTRL